MWKTRLHHIIKLQSIYNFSITYELLYENTVKLESKISFRIIEEFYRFLTIKSLLVHIKYMSHVCYLSYGNALYNTTSNSK